MEATQLVSPMSDPRQLLTLLRYARRALDAAGHALDEAHTLARETGRPDLAAPADFQAWECHLLFARCLSLTKMVEHCCYGTPLPSYEPLSGWLK